MGLEENRPPEDAAALTDGKRWLWPLGYSMIAITPLLAIALWYGTGGHPLTLLLPLLVTFAVLPLIDAVVGEDHNNLSEEMLNAISRDRFYAWAVYAVIPLGYVVFITALAFVVRQEPPLWASLFFVVGTGTLSGSMITIGHELGHKTDPADRLMAKVALGAVGYGHFTAEHNLGHHKNVSTPEDCASGRLGESVYVFATRELPGALKGAWAIERKKLERRGQPVWSRHNEILQTDAITALVGALLVVTLGIEVLPWLILHHFTAWFALTLVNYIEHYGLARQRRENGRYEPCEPRHSWNANHIVSNLVQFHLQRHSDHHAHPARPYQSLRSFEDSPQLPTGYPGCMVMAMIPPLWFQVMDPKVVRWAKGDLQRTNLHAPAKGRLQARFEVSV